MIMNGKDHTLTWLHLSDWHQKSPASVEAIGVMKLLTDDIRYMRDKPHLNEINFMIFSRDVTNSASKQEYNLAKREFFDNVARATFSDQRALRDPEQLRELAERKRRDIFVVPGNHDMVRNNIYAFEPEARELAKDLWNVDIIDTWQTDANIQDRLLKPFENYGEFLEDYITVNTEPGSKEKEWQRQTYPDHSFLDVRYVNGIEVTVCGFNSALFCGRSNAYGATNDYGYLFVGSVARKRILSGVKTTG